MSPLVVQSNGGQRRVILGLMTFGPDEAAGARITELSEFGKTLDLFQARGYGEVDTARVYIGGKQEAFTREARWKDRGLTLATKVKYPNQPGDNEYAKVGESVETSLRELGTDCVDLLYLHAAVRIPTLPTLSS
jgi:aflatoxin B1 aldehyde reductase